MRRFTMFLLAFLLLGGVAHADFTKQKMSKGVPCNYWTILNSSSDYVQNKTSVTLGLYFSKDAFLANKENMQEAQTIVIPGVDLTKAQQQTAIIQQPYFQGSVEIKNK